MQDRVIVWFKKDLRASDHLPLIKAYEAGQILPLYIFEPELWKLSDSSRRHWFFIYDSLQDLNTELGGHLCIRIGEAISILQKLKEEINYSHIFSHEETGNAWTYSRDLAVHEWCKNNSIKWLESPTNGIVRRLKNRDDWTKEHHKRMITPILSKPKNLNFVTTVKADVLPTKDDLLFGDTVGNVQKGGRKEALKVLNSFLNKRANKYRLTISKPGISARHCSRLSSHITYGTLSIKEVFHASWNRQEELKELDKNSKNEQNFKQLRTNISAFLSRIYWHCHFIQKLEDQPSIENKCMHKAFEGMRDTTPNKEYLSAWISGKTGYPLVDACMRSLHENGWLNFRMRAMVISFASYHLWLDWRNTAPLLAKLFTDYEPGIHYSQIQMQSGVTGINTVRIYNPIKQSHDHDPEGRFIKRYVHELKNVPKEWIHEPWLMTDNLQAEYECKIGIDYPEPIVDHKQAVTHARAKIAEVRKSDTYREISKNVYEKLGSRKRPQRSKIKKKEDKKQLKLL